MLDWHTTGPSDGDREVPPPLPISFSSRRSPVLSLQGSVATSQPLASSIGLQILRDKGGNAADASIAVAAALAVLEPCSTGLGGDMFALHYSSTERKVTAVNGSGRAPGNLTLEVLREAHPDGQGGVDAEAFQRSVHSVTVPGAARGWEDALRKYGSGKLTFTELLEPAAKLAEEGFPVAPVTSNCWSYGMPFIRRWVEEGADVPLSVHGNAPKPGEVFRNPDMARVLRTLGKCGATKGFYESDPGESIVAAIQKHGGVMTKEDLAKHVSTYPEAVCAEYKGVKLWQIPPNGQGVAGLIALTGLSELEKRGLCRPISSLEDGSGNHHPQPSADSYHAMIETMRLGFGDARQFVCDPDYAGTTGVSNERLLDKDRIGTRAAELFEKDKAVVQGEPLPTSCTVSFQIVDKDGNAMSFVNSNYQGFGTGLIPPSCGFTLQNRGFGFSTDPSHPNALAPNKRPFHTIIPAMMTHSDTNELYATVSNMGGFMQPQGHMQLFLGMVELGLDPQTAIDVPRFCIVDGTQKGAVSLEDGVSDDTIRTLKSRGHDLNPNVKGQNRGIFGKAQIIKRDRKSGVLWAGSDGRGDGCAMGY